MEFCDDCGAAMVKVEGSWVCRSCSPDRIPKRRSSSTGTPSPRSAGVKELPTTESGAVRKADAMKWLDSLKRPSDDELKRSVIAKPSGFTGSTYPTSISNVRITGDPLFVETVAGLFEPILDLEGANTRVEINLQETEDRDTGEEAGNYALYLSVAERG